MKPDSGEILNMKSNRQQFNTVIKFYTKNFNAD